MSLRICVERQWLRVQQVKPEVVRLSSWLNVANLGSWHLVHRIMVTLEEAGPWSRASHVSMWISGSSFGYPCWTSS